MRYRTHTEADRGRLTRDVHPLNRSDVYRFEVEYCEAGGADVWLSRIGCPVKLTCAHLETMGDGFDYLARIDADADGRGEMLDRLTAHFDAVMLAVLSASLEDYDRQPEQDEPAEVLTLEEDEPTDTQPRKASGVIARWIRTGRHPATD